MEKKKLFVYYYQKNFGDELSRYLVEKLVENVDVVRCKPFSFQKIVKDIIRYVLHPSKANLYSLCLYKPLTRKYIVTGSIIEEADCSTVVWGAGVSCLATKIPSRCEIISVRGPLTLDCIKKAGLATKGIGMGDPALLLPLIYNPVGIGKSCQLGIVVHNIDSEYIISDIISRHVDTKIRIIKLNTANIEKVVQAILECTFILSTSLHGIIVAHSYNISARWIEHNPLLGDGSKFIDYFQSVNLPCLKPIKYTEVMDRIEYSIDAVINECSIGSLPTATRIKQLQTSLLGVCPFL